MRSNHHVQRESSSDSPPCPRAPETDQNEMPPGPIQLICHRHFRFMRWLISNKSTKGLEALKMNKSRERRKWARKENNHRPVKDFKS